jgi:hypothetical protein
MQMRRRQPRIALAAAVAVLLPALAAVPAAAVSTGSPSKAAVRSRNAGHQLPPARKAGRRLDRAAKAAAARARATGRPVVVTADDTPVSQLTANPNGTLTDTISALPVRVRQHGIWVPLSGRLTRGPGRSWRPAAPYYGTVALSGGGSGPLAVITSPAGPALSLRLPEEQRLPAPVIRGATAIYRSIRPGINLQVTASAYSGVVSQLIISSPAAAAAARGFLAKLAWQYAGPALRLSLGRQHTILASVEGAPFDVSVPQMASSGRAAIASGPEGSKAAGNESRQDITSLRARISGTTIATPAAGPQLGRSAAYPVTITSAAAPDAVAPASAQEPAGSGPRFLPDSTVTNPLTAPLTGEAEAKDVGQSGGCSSQTDWWSGTGTDPIDPNPQGVSLGPGIGWDAWPTGTCVAGIFQTYLVFNVSSLGGYYIDSANLYVNEDYSGSDACGTTTKPIYLTSLGPNAGISKSTDGANVTKLTATSPVTNVPPASGTTTSCVNQPAQFDVTGNMNSAATNDDSAWTFGLAGSDATDGSGFLRFGNPSVLQATVDAYPPAPTPEQSTPPTTDEPGTSDASYGCGDQIPPWISSTTPIKVTDNFQPGDTGDPVIPNWLVQDGSGDLWQTSNTGSSEDAGGPESYTIPGNPVNGDEYLWNAATSVNLDNKPHTITGDGTVMCGFTVDNTGPTDLSVSSSTFPVYGSSPGTTQTVPGASGTFSFSAIDPAPSGCSAAEPVTDTGTVGFGGGYTGVGPPVIMGEEDCYASGVYEFRYALAPATMPTANLLSGGTSNCVNGQPTGVVHASNPTGNPETTASANPSAVTTGTSCTIDITQFGYNTLYMQAVDRAGNPSGATYAYHFFVPWDQDFSTVPGDVNSDGIPDLLATMGGSGTYAGDLILYPGDGDPADAIVPSTSLTGANAPPSVASTAEDAPLYSSLGADWSTMQITHRGSWLGTDKSPDDLVVLDTSAGDLELYQNSGGPSGQFENVANKVSTINYPACTPGADPDNASNCANYPVQASGWGSFTQILEPGDAWTGASGPANTITGDTSGHPSLLAIDSNGNLWLFQGYDSQLQNPVLLGTGWSGVTLIAPGDTYIAGTSQLTLWARINSSGDIVSFPIGLSANSVPTLDPGQPAGTMTPSDGTTLMSGSSAISLSASSYPLVASSGPLSDTTCSTTVLLACPGLYAVSSSGELYYYGGQPAATPADALTGDQDRVDLGPIGTDIKQIS